MTAPERPGPERPGPDYPPEWDNEPTQACTCGPGVWGTCDQCHAEACVHHYCPGGCDDVTCESVYLCVGCLTGRPCPMHNGDDGWDDELDEGCGDPDCDCSTGDGGAEGVIAYGRPVTTLQPAERYL